MKSLISILLLLFILTSCFKEDKKIAPHKRPSNDSLYSNTVSMTQTYKNQIFFDLATNTVVAQNNKFIWDLGFESAPERWHIILNTSKFMRAAYTGKTGITAFYALNSANGLNFTFDMSSGNLDSTAIGQWQDTTVTPVPEKIYVIDLGIDENAKPLGYKKIIFLGTYQQSYLFAFSNLDNTEYYRVVISKDATRNFTYFSLINGKHDEETVQIEPEKTKWDLLFTQYTTNLKLNNLPYPYIVSGVLMNRYKVKANRVMNFNFDSITYNYVTTKLGPLSNKQDTIGYAWKEYSRDKGRYTIVTNKYYVVRSINDILYRLRFTGFYNDLGEKGYPSFEYQKL